MKATPEGCFPSHDLLLAWTNFQFSIVAPTAQGPSKAADEVGVEVSGNWCRIDTLTINGCLMRKVLDDQAFAGALVALGRPDGKMKALLFSPETRDIASRHVQLPQGHLNSIEKLALVDSP